MEPQSNKVEIAASLINQCALFMNNAQHAQASEVLHSFDLQMVNESLPLEIIYKRIIYEAELCLRTGDFIGGISCINRNIHLFSNDSAEKFRLLVYRGNLERSKEENFNLNSLCEALGVAENLNNHDLIAEAYSDIATMFAIRYPGLGLYFNRKAESYYLKQGNDHKMRVEAMKRALNSYLLFLRQPTEKTERLKTEAQQIVNSLDTTDFNKFEKLYFQRVKGEINADEDLIETTLNEYNIEEALPDVCRLEDIYMGICVNKHRYDKALSFFPRFRDHVITLHGESVRRQMDELGQMLKSGTVFKYEHPYEFRNPEEPLTLLDVLDHFSLGEELWALDKSVMREVFPSYQHEGMFETLSMPDGFVQLVPCSLSFNDYYRGQASFYAPCKPSLYRSNMTEAKQFIERLKFFEFVNLVSTYPIVDIFKNNIAVKLPDGSVEPISLSVNTLALAQHYGIQTELIDVTCDKFVAAFFACTTCNNGVYDFIKERKSEDGVFYHYVHHDFFGKDEFKLCAVGLQPFSRPGEQKGFVVEMNKDEDFNDLVVEKIRFKHDARIAEFIFNYTNRSKKLFPENILQEKAEQIIRSYKFSERAYQQAKKIYYPEIPEEKLQNFLSEERIEIVKNPIVVFSEEERQQCLEEWNKKGKKKMFDQILVRYAQSK